jgi:AhpD family alkylhydroperoxidase
MSTLGRFSGDRQIVIFAGYAQIAKSAESEMRVPGRTLLDYPWIVRLFFWNQNRKYGQILEPAKLWGRSPWVFATLALLYGALDRKRSPIEPPIRSLVTVRVSQINHCAFCVDINSATLLKHGVTMDKMLALQQWQDSSLFTERERVAVEYAEAITYPDRGVTDALFERLKGHFDDDALVELTGLIAFQNMSSKFNAALAVPAQGFCPLPARVAATSCEPTSGSMRG